VEKDQAGRAASRRETLDILADRDAETVAVARGSSGESGVGDQGVAAPRTVAARGAESVSDAHPSAVIRDACVDPSSSDDLESMLSPSGPPVVGPEDVDPAGRSR
jgi:hypothetical protein